MAGDLDKQQCSLLLFVATPSEHKAVENAASSRNLPFEKVSTDYPGDYWWIGRVGDERVIVVRAEAMGPLGRGGSADLALRFKQFTGATAIVQVGMAFGAIPHNDAQRYCDVLVSSSLIPYDNRDVVPREPLQKNGRQPTKCCERLLGCIRSVVAKTGVFPKPLHEEPPYQVKYERAVRQRASEKLLALFLREKYRGGYSHGIHIGALLSGGARIHTRIFRDELIRKVPAGDDQIVGGEMEAVGLLGASDEPVWCVVKGIVDFADENRDAVYKKNRPDACRNATEFVFNALVNDARR